MKRNSVILGLVLALCLSVMLTACGGSDSSSVDPGSSEGSKADNKGGNYSILYMSSLEIGAGNNYSLTSTFSVKDSKGNAVTSADGLSAKATITNSKGVVVYDGAPSVSVEGSIVNCKIDYANVTAGSTLTGNLSIALTAGSTTSEPATYALKSLPYDMSDIVLPKLPVTVNKLSGDGQVSATMSITEVTPELKYLGETVTVRINIKGTRTYTDGNNNYVGTKVVVTVDGAEVDSADLVGKVDENGLFEGYTNIEFAPGSSPVITFNDYR